MESTNVLPRARLGALPRRAASAKAATPTKARPRRSVGGPGPGSRRRCTSAKPGSGEAGYAEAGVRDDVVAAQSRVIGRALRNQGRSPAAALLILFAAASAQAQFIDHFGSPAIGGWTWLTGDGEALMDMRQRDGYASIYVDATRDRHNIWWALVKHEVSDALDLSLVPKPRYELRVEARIRASHAPRRVNLHVNTQRTVDFHTHLMEFDIPDTSSWHTISMTTDGFDARSSDTVNGQLAMIDWGLGKYRLDIDYFKVDVVDTVGAEPDLGEQVPYHPPIRDPEAFEYHVPVAEDAVVDLDHPDLNLDGWYAIVDSVRLPALTVEANRFVILRWDLTSYADREPADSGLLELTSIFLSRASYSLEEFGQVRVVEILGGDPEWKDELVTLNSLAQGRPLEAVFNTQMIIDVDVNETMGGSNLITISRPVLRRMLDGTTHGLLIRPLGPVSAAFFSREHAEGRQGAVLHFTLR